MENFLQRTRENDLLFTTLLYSPKLFVGQNNLTNALVSTLIFLNLLVMFCLGLEHAKETILVLSLTERRCRIHIYQKLISRRGNKKRKIPLMLQIQL